MVAQCTLVHTSLYLRTVTNLRKKDLQGKAQMMFASEARFYKKASTQNILLTSFLHNAFICHRNDFQLRASVSAISRMHSIIAFISCKTHHSKKQQSINDISKHTNDYNAILAS